jgi:hypothetical protein
MLELEPREMLERREMLELGFNPQALMGNRICWPRAAPLP